VYTGNNPINRIDPTGNDFIEYLGILAGRAGVATTTAYFVVRAYSTLMYYAGQLAPYTFDEINDLIQVGQFTLMLGGEAIAWVQTLSQLQVQPGTATQTTPPLYTEPTYTHQTEEQESQDRKAVIIGAGAPGTPPEALEQVRHLAVTYDNQLIVNELFPTSAFLWENYVPGLLQYHEGPAQTLGLQNNADIFAIAPSKGGILAEIREIADSLIGVNSTLYLAIDGSQYDELDLKAKLTGYQVRTMVTWYTDTSIYGPIIISSKPIYFMSSYFISPFSSNEDPNRLIQVNR